MSWRGGGVPTGTRCCSSPGPTSTGRRWPGRPRRAASTRRHGPTRSSSAGRPPGPSWTSPTTTSSAPPRRHVRPVQHLWQRLYDQGDVYLDSYEGLYCVACEQFYSPEELVDGNCPIPTWRRSGRRTTSSASPSTPTGCWSTTASTRSSSAPTPAGARSSPSSSRTPGPLDLAVQLHLGSADPGTPSTSCTSGSTPCRTT